MVSAYICSTSFQHGADATTEKQTVAFNIKARTEFKSRKRARMGIWQAMEMLNTLVDDSDPDVSDSLTCDFPLLTLNLYSDRAFAN
jgi:hypothetical protein